MLLLFLKYIMLLLNLRLYAKVKCSCSLAKNLAFYSYKCSCLANWVFATNSILLVYSLTTLKLEYLILYKRQGLYINYSIKSFLI